VFNKEVGVGIMDKNQSEERQGHLFHRSISIPILLTISILLLNSSDSLPKEIATENLAFMEIEDVFAAAKHLQKVRKAPASITIITDDDIRKYGYRKMSDVLNNTKSFYIYSDRNYDYIGVRGFARLGDYGNRVLQLVDGHTYNDNVYGSVFFDNEFGIDLDLIKKIEVVRGPCSTLYGSNGLFGIVNVVTKSGHDINGFYIKSEAGSYDTYKGTFIFGKRFENDFDLIFSVSLLDSEGQDLYFVEFDDPVTSNGWARDADGEKAGKIFLKSMYHELMFIANVSWREKHVPTASYETIFNDNRHKTIDQRSFAEIKLEHAFESNKELMARIYYDRYDFVGEYPLDYPPVTLNKDESYGQWMGTELRYFQRLGTSHHINLGGEAILHINADQKNYDVEPPVTYLDDNRSFTTWSAFVQDEWDISLWLRLTAGFRYDHSTTFGEHVSPRIGIIGQLTRESTLKLLYGQAFRAPTVYELYYQDDNDTAKANPDLEPEIVDTYEIIWEQELGPILKGAVSAFRYEVRDLITQVEDPDDGLLQFQNIEHIKSDGIEIGLEANWPNVIKGHIGYTFQETVNKITDQRLSNSPRHLVKAGVTIPIYKDKLFLGTQSRFMDERLTRNGQHADRSIITDLNIYAHNLVKGLDLSLGIFNLFDEDYSDPVSAAHLQETIEQDGVNFWLKVSYSF